jgi:DoxX-like family
VATSGKVVWVGRVISLLVALLFVFSAVMKAMGIAAVKEGMAHLGLREPMLVPLAVIELACAVLYLVPATAVLGAILLTGFIGGTIVTHWRVAEPVYIQVALGLLVWLGLYLREERLRALLPVRRR